MVSLVPIFKGQKRFPPPLNPMPEKFAKAYAPRTFLPRLASSAWFWGQDTRHWPAHCIKKLQARAAAAPPGTACAWRRIPRIPRTDALSRLVAASPSRRSPATEPPRRHLPGGNGGSLRRVQQQNEAHLPARFFSRTLKPLPVTPLETPLLERLLDNKLTSKSMLKSFTLASPGQLQQAASHVTDTSAHLPASAPSKTSANTAMPRVAG